MKTVLPSIINPDQTSFLKGRFIGENIRLIDGVIDYTEFKGIPGLLLFVDFEKAFDTLEWSFIVTPFKSQDKWKLVYGEINKDLEWNKTYILPFQCTKDINLQSFQFKLLHRRNATNDFLIERNVYILK